MNEFFSGKNNMKKNVVLTLAALLSLLYRMQRLEIPLINDFHSFRQTQTAIVVQNYFRDGWSLLKYEIPVLGYPYKIIFECPIYQSVVYFLMSLFKQSNIDYCGRIVSLLIFYLSAWMLKKLIDLIGDGEYSYYVCIVYLLLPFNIYWSTAVLIDYMSVLFALAYAWGLYGWLSRNGKYRYLIAIIFGSLGYLLKSTTMFPIVFFLAFLIIRYLVSQMKQTENSFSVKSIVVYIKNNFIKLIGLMILCCFPVMIGYLWTHYADMVKGASMYTAWLTSENLSSWNYGTWAQKTDMNNWGVILKRIYGTLGNKYIVLFMIIAYVWNCNKRNCYLILTSLASVLLTIFSLFNLYYVHDYYLIAVIPFICIFQGIVFYDIVHVFQNEKTIGNMLVSMMAVVLIYAQVNTNKTYLDGLKGTTENNSIGMYIKNITDETERIFIEGEDWSPVTMYYADRKGFMLKIEDWFTEKFCKNVIEADKYTTLVAHNLDKVCSVFNNFDIIIQYPRFNDIYTYKYYKLSDFNNIVNEHIYSSCYYDGHGYNIQEMPTEYICIEYEKSDENVELPIVITSQTGEEYRDTIILLKEKDVVYYNVSEICNMPQTLRIEGTENLDVVISY